LVTRFVVVFSVEGCCTLHRHARSGKLTVGKKKNVKILQLVDRN
jgi:hypothetical protein